jgi:hypothetical protein
MQIMLRFRLWPMVDARILHASQAFIKGAVMELSTRKPVLALELGQVVTLDDAAGHSIRTRSGTVWVTEEGNFKDFIVGPGEVLVVKAGGRTVLQALQPACISIR